MSIQRAYEEAQDIMVRRKTAQYKIVKEERANYHLESKEQLRFASCTRDGKTSPSDKLKRRERAQAGDKSGCFQSVASSVQDRFESGSGEPMPIFEDGTPNTDAYLWMKVGKLGHAAFVRMS